MEELLIETREELRRVVLDSIYVPGRCDKDKGVVTLLNSEVVDADDYVVNMVRELRNTYHGYHTSKFDQYLSTSTGNTPDTLPLIGLLAFLALLAKPNLFVERYWN